MNEIYKKLTTIKYNELKFEKVFKKITFPFSKVNFSLLEKKILKKVDFSITFVHMNVRNFRQITNFQVEKFERSYERNLQKINYNYIK